MEGCFCVYARKPLTLLAFRAFSIFSATGIGWISPPETYRVVAAALAGIQNPLFLNPPIYKSRQKGTV
jgi:hypothetical protein